jgi:hypothetical protein
MVDEESVKAALQHAETAFALARAAVEKGVRYEKCTVSEAIFDVYFIERRLSAARKMTDEQLQQFTRAFKKRVAEASRPNMLFGWSMELMVISVAMAERGLTLDP